VVSTHDAQELAASTCRSLADAILSERDAFRAELTDVDQAIAAAIAPERRPVLLVDIADNIGGGTPGDGTVLLDGLLRTGARDAIVIIADPESVNRCCSAGVGATVKLTVGGKVDGLHGRPVDVEGKVRRLCDGVFLNIGQMRDGIVDDQGLTAVVACGGVTLVLTSKKMMPWNLEQLRSCGIEPTRAGSIVLKSAVAYRAAYLPIAAEVITVDTPGLTSPNLSRFTYRNLPPELRP
jgi:microcystin degradation protein MlrC